MKKPTLLSTNTPVHPIKQTPIRIAIHTKCTQSYQMHPVDIQGLKPNIEPPDGCLPPKIVKLRGRPKTVRIRKGQKHRKKRRCGNCGQLATHNARTCRAQPCDIEQEQEQEQEQEHQSYSEQMIQSRAEARARARQQELEDELEEAAFEEELAAIQVENRPISRHFLGSSSSIRSWDESSNDNSQLDTDPLGLE